MNDESYIIVSSMIGFSFSGVDIATFKIPVFVSGSVIIASCSIVSGSVSSDCSAIVVPSESMILNIKDCFGDSWMVYLIRSSVLERSSML